MHESNMLDKIRGCIDLLKLSSLMFVQNFQSSSYHPGYALSELTFLKEKSRFHDKLVAFSPEKMTHLERWLQLHSWDCYLWNNEAGHR